MALALTIPGGAVQLSGNPIWAKVTGASAPVGSTGYNIILKITSTDGIVTGGPFIDAIPPNAAGVATFDISGLVDIPVTPQFEWPLVTGSKSYIDAAWNIKVEFGEMYINSSGVLVTTWQPTNSLIQIIKGGISDFKIGEYNDAATSFYAQIIAKGKFLTNQPTPQTVSPTQNVKLYLISPYAVNTTISVVCTGYYSDNSTAVHTESCELFVDGLFEFNLNPAHVGLAMVNIAGKPMVRFTIGWGNPATVGDLREYLIDWNYHEQNNYLFAANSLSGVDVHWLTGEVKKGIDIAGTEGVKPMAQGAGARSRTVLTTGISGRKKITINTGYKSAAEIEALEDVYLSRNLWLLMAGKLIPVKLINSEKLLNDTTEDVHAVDLEFEESHIKRFV